MQIRDRIKSLRRVRAADLRPNPKNWRTHPQAQQDALRGVLADVGIADAVLARELPDGSLMLLDGHLRVETLPDAKLPVLILDVTEEEGDKILATLDPLAAMAESDAARLQSLLDQVETESEALRDMLDDLASEAGLGKANESSDDGESPDPDYVPVLQAGDVVTLGRHRLVVGDTRSPEVVAAVLGADVPQLSIVDPPFDLPYADWGWPDSDVFYVWGRGDKRIIWEAREMVSRGLGVHELVFTGGVRGQAQPALPCCLHDVVHVWRRAWWPKGTPAIDPRVIRDCGCAKTEDDRPRSVQEHCGGVLAAQSQGMSWSKPVVAMAIGMAYVAEGAIVWDPCAGGGSSLLAAERHNRTWRGGEYQPQWADLIVRRFARDTAGSQPITLARGGECLRIEVADTGELLLHREASPVP